MASCCWQSITDGCLHLVSVSPCKLTDVSIGWARSMSTCLKALNNPALVYYCQCQGCQRNAIVWYAFSRGASGCIWLHGHNVKHFAFPFYLPVTCGQFNCHDIAMTYKFSGEWYVWLCHCAIVKFLSDHCYAKADAVEQTSGFFRTYDNVVITWRRGELLSRRQNFHLLCTVRRLLDLPDYKDSYSSLMI